jgi:hypothetical protein
MEFYAKITFMDKGMYRYCATVWKSENGIDSVWRSKKFFGSNRATLWSKKIITKSVADEKHTMFIREQDAVRRRWN